MYIKRGSVIDAKFYIMYFFFNVSCLWNLILVILKIFTVSLAMHLKCSKKLDFQLFFDEMLLGVLLPNWYVTQFCTSQQTYSWIESITSCHSTTIHCATDIILTATGSCHWLCTCLVCSAQLSSFALIALLMKVFVKLSVIKGWFVNSVDLWYATFLAL